LEIQKFLVTFLADTSQKIGSLTTEYAVLLG
jgi:hypothetical protein